MTTLETTSTAVAYWPSSITKTISRKQSSSKLTNQPEATISHLKDRQSKTNENNRLKGRTGNRHFYLNVERKIMCFGPVFCVPHVKFIVYFS